MTSRQADLRSLYRTPVKESFPETLKIQLGTNESIYHKTTWTHGTERLGLRYGSNPHQRAALYCARDSFFSRVEWVKWGKGGPSATNIQDGSRGLRIVSAFDKTSVAVMKHLNPSGVAVGRDKDSTGDVYLRARNADPRAAFGSVVTLNVRVDAHTAKEIISTFVEVVYAPGYGAGALDVFGSKKDLRVAKTPSLQALRNEGPSYWTLDDGSIILEDPLATSINSVDELKTRTVPTKKQPTDQEYIELLEAWRVVVEVRSNAVVLWKNGQSLGIGTGLQDRIGAIEQATQRAKSNGHDLSGSVLASDGFLPKMDNIELAASAGVTAIVQPGGSVEDPNLIEACDKFGMSMILTAERAFKH